MLVCSRPAHSLTETNRPALDSVEAAVDRAVRMPLGRRQGKSDFKPLPFFWRGSATVRGRHTQTHVGRRQLHVFCGV